MCRLGILLLCGIGSVGADDPGENTTLFVSSAPLKATLTMDGAALAQRTPVLVRGLAPGTHSYTISLDGFESRTGSVELVSGEVAGVTHRLDPVTETGIDDGEAQEAVAAGDALLSGGKLLDALTS